MRRNYYHAHFTEEEIKHKGEVNSQITMARKWSKGNLTQILKPCS